MSWKFDGSSPIYLQIADRLLDDICGGKYASGERLPSVRDLAQIAGVNPNTVQRAFGELEHRGILSTNGTQGRTVLTDSEAIKQCKERLADSVTDEYLEKMQNLGYAAELITQIVRARLFGEKNNEEGTVN